MKFLFVPGVNNTQNTWAPVCAALREAGHECVAVDCPPIADVEELAKTLLPADDSEFVVVGHSFGGMVALSLMALAPERIQGVVLVNSTDGSDSPEVAQARAGRVEEARNGGYLKIAAGATARAYHPDNLKRDDLMANREREVAEYGVERFAAHQLAMGSRPNREAAFAAFPKPKLVVAADNDVVIPTAKQKAMAERVGAVYHEIPTTGHMLPAEAPEELAGIINDWAQQSF
ncbi:alpha/beta fold hydrolase [Marinobacter sp. X15-166B]|uniref:alpha/beta fold hydrolase n=1 Tax=Marinobacter sp. X15-166B TaxID=1897620 RepID=UPI00085C91DC|nr:alpha/beta hydrolase [Marinobacter sp. X15-166B]OEY66119.1 hypothetical protein BG841_06365 [Marinobacter sp. X15-166B]